MAQYLKHCHTHRIHYGNLDGCPMCKAERAQQGYTVACPLHPEAIVQKGKACPQCEMAKPKRYKEPSAHQKDMLDAIDALEDKFKHLVNEGKTMDNSRRIAMAEANVEQGLMWLRKAVMKADKED